MDIFNWVYLTWKDCNDNIYAQFVKFRMYYRNILSTLITKCLIFFRMKEINTYKFFKIDNCICDDLYFDKTSDLRGYNLKVAGIEDGIILRYDQTKTGYGRFTGMINEIVCTVLNIINATVTIKWSKSLGFINNHGKLIGSLNDIAEGTVDLRLTTSLMPA